jgi:hypothetical protein
VSRPTERSPAVVAAELAEVRRHLEESPPHHGGGRAQLEERRRRIERELAALRGHGEEHGGSR